MNRMGGMDDFEFVAVIDKVEKNGFIVKTNGAVNPVYQNRRGKIFIAKDGAEFETIIDKELLMAISEYRAELNHEQEQKEAMLRIARGDAGKAGNSEA